MHGFSPALLPSLHAFMGSSGEQNTGLPAQGGQPGPFLGSNALLSPWFHAGRVWRIPCVGEAALQHCVIRADKRVPALITA